MAEGDGGLAPATEGRVTGCDALSVDEQAVRESKPESYLLELPDTARV